MYKTKKDNDKHIERKLNDMIRGHEGNFDTDGEIIRIKVVSNKIIKITYTTPDATDNEPSPEPVGEETEISIGSLETLIEAHALSLDGKHNVRTQVATLAARYGKHEIRDVTEEE